jgi:hypothetical protein
VVAVSEKMLNDQLESYFWAEPNLQTMNANFVMVEIKNGKLLPSRVTIPIMERIGLRSSIPFASRALH